MEFETARLNVSRWSDAFSATSLRAVLTPPVLAHLPRALQHTDPDTWIAERVRDSHVFAVAAEGRLIGVLLLAQLDTPHLGYLLAEDAWGKGYASELVRGLVDALPDTPLRAGVARDNPASIRVLEKAGFALVASGPDQLMFQLERR